MRSPFVCRSSSLVVNYLVGKQNFEKKSHNAEQRLRGGPFSLARYYDCGKKETFFCSSLVQQVQHKIFVERLVELISLLRVYRKKTLTKSAD